MERFARDGGYLDRLATAIAAARSAGIAVTYVTVGFRPGYPEVSERNKSFSAVAGSGRFTDADPGVQIPAVIAPAPGEVTVTKRRVSAFTGSDLEVLLRARGTGHLVLAGIATSGVVLSTLRQAADLDYQLTVLADGCLDPRSRSSPGSARQGISAPGAGHHHRRLGEPAAPTSTQRRRPLTRLSGRPKPQEATR